MSSSQSVIVRRVSRVKDGAETMVMCWFDASRFVMVGRAMGGQEIDKGVSGSEKSAGGDWRRAFSFACLSCRRLSKDGLEDLSASRNDALPDEGPGHGNC